MSKLRALSCKLAVAAVAVLLSANASAATLARQSGAFGIVTYDLPPVSETQTTPVPVPYAWLMANDPDVVDEYEAYEAAAKKTAANGWKVWECYLVGVSPADETAEFTAMIEMQGETPIVTWDPNLNTNGVIRTYKVYGCETLENGGEWQYPTNSLHRFFKVSVEMP